MKIKALLISCLLASIGQLAAQERRFVLDPALRPGDYDLHTVVVKYRPATAASGRVATPSARNNAVLSRLGVQEIGRMFPNSRPVSARSGRVSATGKPLVDLSNIYQVTLPAGQKVEAAINTLLTDPTVEYAEPVYTNYQPLHLPNDPEAQPGTGRQYALTNIKAYEAWDVHKGNPNVVVGIIDYGFDVNHDDLKNQIAYNTADPVDGRDNDKDGYVDNYAGWNVLLNTNNVANDAHGSRVAGCAAGQADNGIGVAGVAYNCRFMAVSGYDAATRRFSGFAGVVYLAEKGCKVINISWGRPSNTPSFLEQDVMNYAAINHDVVLVASAGNESVNVSRYWWPASYENVISVAATGPTDLRAVWAGTGGSAYNDKVDISAPGQDILSTQNGNGYQFDSGTSYSSPMVAGAAALVRSLYPQLSAEEVARRLIATADPIDNLPANIPFASGMGSGRLNVFRALTETSPKAVVLAGTTLQNTVGQPYLLPNTDNTLTVSVRNAGADLTNAQLSLAANTPLVEISGPAALGAVATNATATGSFTVRVSNQILVNAPITFTATLTDGPYTRRFSWTAFVNPDYLDIAVNQTGLTATSNGRIGFAGDYSFWNAGIVPNRQALGNGVRFGGQQLLFEAGLVLAADESRVSDAVRGDGPQYRRNQHFESVRNVASQNYPPTDASAAGLFREDWYHWNRIGLEVEHQTYAWRNAPNDRFVIVEYKIRNRSGSTLDSLFAGLFADWEIGTRQGNQADWDATRRLGYVFNPTGSHPYAGVQLLTTQTPQYYAFDSQDGINIFDGFTAAEKFQAMNGTAPRTRTASGADDVAHLLAARIQNLADGDSAIVAFAVLGANSLPELQAAADAARQKFVEINRSPRPVVPRVQTCRGGRVMIAPTPGRTFRFYQKQPDGNLQPLSAGRELTLENVKNDTTLFVTNADSLFESEPVPVRVEVFGAKFSTNKDSLGIADGDVLQLTNQAETAVRWQWNFGDGTASTEPNPTHTYREAGTYEVQLIAESTEGCRDTTVRTVRVFPGILSPPPVVQPVTICAGDSVVIVPSNARLFTFYNQRGDSLTTAIRYNAGRIYRDTLFYVASTDFLVKSVRVAVQITAVQMKADFSLATDTIDLARNEQLAVTNRTTGAVRWHWDFGDDSTSTTKNPTHRYAKEGVYTVKLRVENVLGCADTLSKRVVVLRSTGQLAAGIRLGPNPTSDLLTIQRDIGLQIRTVTMRVYNAAGQEVFRSDNLPYRSQLDFRSYARGLYVVTFQGDGQRLTQKLIVN